jgi:RecB family exonuclease
MLRLLQLCSIFILTFVINNTAYAQNKKLSLDDKILQDSIYKSNKKKVLNFSMKDFDKLFFEYFTKKSDPNITLTKTEFYSYTVKIAAFSDRLAVLYPDQKKMAEENKETWLSESYEEYLQHKSSQKK